MPTLHYHRYPNIPKTRHRTFGRPVRQSNPFQTDFKKRIGTDTARTGELDKRTRIIEQIRTAVIQYVHYNDAPEKKNLSDYISSQCKREYSLLSKLFAETNGITIEKYYIAQKIERVKELLIYGELSISEIADKLHYSSSAHLSTQFRSVTGLSPTQFKQLKNPQLKPLDEV